MKKSNVKAILVNFNYTLGLRPLYNYEATPLSNDEYLLKRPNGEFLKCKVGDEIDEVGTVSEDEFGNLSIGEYTVPVGQNLHRTFLARPLNKEETKYAIVDHKGSVVKRIELGSVDEEGGMITLDKYKNIIIGDSSIKALPLFMKTSLKIIKDLPKEDADKLGLNGASRAVFNVSHGADLAQESATFGYFIPKSQNSRAKHIGQFREFFNDELVTTAELYNMGKNGSIVRMRVRSPETAYLSHIIFQEKLEHEKLLKGLSQDSLIGSALAKSGMTMSNDDLDKYKRELSARVKVLDKKLAELSKKWVFTEIYNVSVGKEYISKLSPNMVKSEPEAARQMG